jgi:hypothetical protein
MNTRTLPHRLRFFTAPADGSGTGTQPVIEPAKPGPPATEPPASGAGQPPAQEDPTDWKAEARKWEARAKENRDAVDKLAEREKAELTEVERARREAEEAKAEAAKYRQRDQIAQWKAEVSTATGVPAGALAGSTLEELQAHAEVLKPLIGTGPKGPVVPAEGTHAATTQAVTQLTDADLKTMTPSEINKARREGRLNKVLGVS